MVLPDSQADQDQAEGNPGHEAGRDEVFKAHGHVTVSWQRPVGREEDAGEVAEREEGPWASIA